MSKGAWSTSPPAYAEPINVRFMDTAIGVLPSAPASIGSSTTIAQAISYILNAGVVNADKLDGMHAADATSSTASHVPFIKANGVLEVGRYIDFHHAIGNGANYNARLETNGVTDGELFINGSRIIKQSALLEAMQSVDGASSGLDADLLDGQHGSYYAQASHTHPLPAVIELACSGVASAGANPIVVANRVAVTRCRQAQTISLVRASLDIASTSGIVTIRINKNGTSIFSTNLTIDATELTSKTAATAYVLKTTSLAEDDEISVDVIASGTAARGLVVAIIGAYS